MLFRRTSPYTNLDAQNPMLSYTVRHVRGGRSAPGTIRFTWIAFWIMLAAGIVPLVLFLWLYEPSFRDDYYWFQVSFVYIMGAGGLMTFMFTLVDFFTVFYAVNSIRADTQSGTLYDLLRSSTVDTSAYVDARLALARVRAWRIMVFMWAGRLVAVGMLLVLGVTGFGILLYEDEMGNALMDETFWFAILFGMIAGIVFLVQFLGEPFWRLDMMNAYAASVAARYNSNATTWSILGLGLVAILFLQGMMGAAVVYGSLGLHALVDEVLSAINAGYSWDFRDRLGLTFAVIPYMLVPWLTWFGQRRLYHWRRQVTIRHIFRHRGVDA